VTGGVSGQRVSEPPQTLARPLGIPRSALDLEQSAISQCQRSAIALGSTLAHALDVGHAPWASAR
jgi:hypothetical protein